MVALDADALLAAFPDDEVLAFAISEQRIVVTHNVKDFVPLIRAVGEAARSHAGCVLVLLPTNAFGAVLRGLDELFRSYPASKDWLDRVEFLA